MANDNHRIQLLKLLFLLFRSLVKIILPQLDLYLCAFPFIHLKPVRKQIDPSLGPRLGSKKRLCPTCVDSLLLAPFLHHFSVSFSPPPFEYFLYKHTLSRLPSSLHGKKFILVNPAIESAFLPKMVSTPPLWEGGLHYCGVFVCTCFLQSSSKK